MARSWILALSLAACGPVAYVNQVTRTADAAVEAARTADAAKYAPYWWTRATEYLHKARENAARADFQGANRWGKLAADAAAQALVEADMQRASSTRPATLAPAKETP